MKEIDKNSKTFEDIKHIDGKVLLEKEFSK